MFWEIFWQVVFVAAVLFFPGLAVVVSIGGLADIRAMLSRLDEQHDAEAGDDTRPD